MQIGVHNFPQFFRFYFIFILVFIFISLTFLNIYNILSPRVFHFIDFFHIILLKISISIFKTFFPIFTSPTYIPPNLFPPISLILLYLLVSAHLALLCLVLFLGCIMQYYLEHLRVYLDNQNYK